MTCRQCCCYARRTLVSLILAAVTTTAAEPDSITVARVIDGDTFVTSDSERVRLIGIDTPELHHPAKPVEWYAVEAADYLDSLTAGKVLRLEYEGKKRDRWGRLLAYVWTTGEDDSTLVNFRMVADGYAMAFLAYSHPREEEFLAAEIKARKQRLGMWGSPK